MAQVPTQYVKRGLWEDVKKGPVMGKTITTDTSTGNIVIAILTVLTGFGIAHLWSVLLFAIHQIRADGHAQDALFRQQQALLRTQPPPGSLLMDWWKLFWVWRKSHRAFIRSLLLIFLASLFATATILVGIFSSYVVSSGPNINVLVSSPHCGPFSFKFDSNTFTTVAPILSYLDKRQSLARSYSQDCYQNVTTLPQQCLSFVKPRIQFAVNRTDCPFEQDLCVNIASPGLVLDSGLVDLSENFGLNLEAGNSVKYRKRTSCAIMNLEGHYSIQNVSDLQNLSDHRDPWTPGEQMLVLRLGGSYQRGYDNITGTQSLFLSNVTYNYDASSNSMRYSDPGFSKMHYNSLRPLPNMLYDDADLILINVFKNKVRYAKPVDDPLFAAHIPSIRQNLGSSNSTVYLSDFPASVVGCKIQYQFCIGLGKSPDVCTDLNGIPAEISSLHLPGASGVQLAIIKLLTALSTQVDFQTACDVLKASSLIGITLADVIAMLPTDQWVQEIVGWEAYLWAAYQILVSDYSIGVAARAPDAASFVSKNMTEGEKQLCTKQKMRNPGGFVNVNVFGLAFIITFWVVFTLLDLFLVKFLIYTERLRHPRIDRWIQDGTLQLQRRAYEAHGEGTWRRLSKEIPKTVRIEKLNELPLESRPTSPKKRTLSSPEKPVPPADSKFAGGVAVQSDLEIIDQVDVTQESKKTKEREESSDEGHRC